MITEQEENVITSVISAYTIMTLDLERAHKPEVNSLLRELVAEWIKPRSYEFKRLFATTARELADQISKGGNKKEERNGES